MGWSLFQAQERNSQHTSDRPLHHDDEDVSSSSRVISFRGVLAGIVGVVLICALTPYNNCVIGNTYFVGGALPIGLLLYMMVLLLVNALLHRFVPRRALRPHELVVATVMSLVSCALPGTGLMQYLLAPIVGLYNQAGVDYDSAKLLADLGLPDWLFPVTAESSLGAKATDPVIRHFWARTPAGEGFGPNDWTVPWLAWVRPMLSWGILAAAISGMVVSLSCLLHRQWADNERLPFPIASIYASMLEPPSPGRAFNALLANHWFWIAAVAVFILHSLSVLALYFPKVVPAVPLSFNLASILADPPFSYADPALKANRIFFMVVGLTFFLQGRIALSLWLGYVAIQLARMYLGGVGSEISDGMRRDQTFGSMIVYMAMILWLGRQHWRMVLHRMAPWLIRICDNAALQDKGRFVSYPVAGWCFVLCSLGIAAWLVAAGASWWGALILVAVLVMFLTLIARVAAETGMAFVHLLYAPQRLWTCLRDWSGGAFVVSPKTFFLTTFVNATFMHDSREPLAVYAPHALKTADTVEGNRQGRLRGLIPAILLALVIAFLVSGASTLWVEYNYSATAGHAQQTPLNQYGINYLPEQLMLRPTKQYLTGAGPGGHSAAAHVSAGAAATGTLAFLTMRFANWPLHPIGFLVAYSFPMTRMWFSIFIGWLLKSLIVRYGGASMFRGAKPLFIGLIIGEAGAAGFWLVISLILHALGIDYHAVYFTP